jgi:hypothetical protein
MRQSEDWLTTQSVRESGYSFNPNPAHSPVLLQVCRLNGQAQKHLAPDAVAQTVMVIYSYYIKVVAVLYDQLDRRRDRVGGGVLGRACQPRGGRGEGWG